LPGSPNYDSNSPRVRPVPRSNNSSTKIAAPEGMSFWDTSSLGKLYLPEPDSAAFAQKAAVEPAIVTTRLAVYGQMHSNRSGSRSPAVN